jgi:hypothetical protein
MHSFLFQALCDSVSDCAKMATTVLIPFGSVLFLYYQCCIVICCAVGAGVNKGSRTLVLENICDCFEHPCILDVKLGFRTTYLWADAAYNDKNRCGASNM